MTTALEIGTAIVSYIEPHEGLAREFNEWYERDHFPATVLAGPGVFTGARFVATRACKTLRPDGATLFGDPARGSYLAVAFVVAGKQTEWDTWVAREMETIAAQNRLFPGRDHVHTGVYRFESARGAIPPVNILDRAWAGVVLLASTGASPLQPPGAAVVTLESERTIISEADPPPHRLVLWFTATDPCAAFAAARRSVADCAFASPFLATVPGTHTYSDDL